ncbi:NAD-dependent epimerase/dehydratase family protein [Conexibacter arvalis]|uniref:Nucleoside-diphosphate-sugar epimerase n=1 Tax=Conexibacter arvalis TaxID=912552 RepID=A0A840I9D8_9ACTN|nr:NAD(P)-dependent oxidoreductase [Conexibacter arvalis]MBB4660718.1 nucleoside-diphosphate-sugar epimerase [Conexibacter arvalis]
MRVFLAGATGAIGRPLVRRLLAAGHAVVGTTRTQGRAAALRAAGAEAVVLDALDAAALRRAVLDARPEVVLNELTDLSAPLNPRRYAQWLESTQRLRTESTATLLDAGREAGARRIVVQSVCFVTAQRGPWVLDEDAPLDDAAPELTEPVAAMERMVVDADGIEGLVLRYGWFYGPGTSIGPGGQHAEMVRRRRLPIIGAGDGRWSFVHVDDAAAATVLALDAGGRGVLNVVDDEPAPQREWVPELARAIGAPPPRTVPAWLARAVGGELIVRTGTTMRGASNARARERLGWRPGRPSWREGFAETFAERAAANV